MAGAVAFVLKGYPRLSETFIAQEILALERRGLDIRIVSLRHPTEDKRHPIHAAIAAPVLYLPEYLRDAPGRVLAAWRAGRRRPGYRAARAAWLRDMRRDPTPNRGRRFGQALVLAHELPDGVDRLHAHFLHTPASVARYAAMIAGLPWSCSAHAKDIWTSPDWEKREKLADAAWFTTCTAFARDHLVALAPALGQGMGQGTGQGTGPGTARVELAYHGLDFADLPPPDAEPRPDSRPDPRPDPVDPTGRDGARSDAPVRLLTVGRAVEKKGFDVLLEALALLPPDLHWRLTHVGGGPLLPRLKEQARAAGIAERVDWRGAAARAAVFGHYRQADLFVLPCRVAPDGDRDGLPNVLMEAQSQGVACISTGISGIPELIEDGVTGRLVAPEDAAALAAALAELIASPAPRARLGRLGSERVRERFSHEPGIALLAARFGLAGRPAPDAQPDTRPEAQQEAARAGLP